MKRSVAFFSDSGTQLQTLLALAIAKPKDICITWYVLITESLTSEELFDHLVDLQQYIPCKNWKFSKKKHELLFKYHQYRFSKFKLNNIVNIPSLENVTIEVVGNEIYSQLLDARHSAVVFPTVRLFGNNPISFLRKLSKKLPIFLHEYGTTFKNISAFDYHPERHSFFSCIFCHGKIYQKQLNDKKIAARSVITGFSKSDLYFMNDFFAPPTTKPYLVYCNTVEVLSNDSNPNFWIPILLKSCELAGYKLIVKLHPYTYLKYAKEKWINLVYFGSYTASLFKNSSGIISEPSTILLDAMLAGKPIFTTNYNFKKLAYLDNFKNYSFNLSKNYSHNAKIFKKYATNCKINYSDFLQDWYYKADGQASKRIWRQIVKKIK